MAETATPAGPDARELESKVKDMYRDVAVNPRGEYHFEMGRGLAEKLGYPAEILDRIPAAAVESFAGVGYFFDLASLEEGERVLDLGSGSGADVFFAAIEVGSGGRVTGLDMTDEQIEKAEALRDETGFEQVDFAKGRIEKLPFEDGRFDCVISNGVINLSPEKDRVFREAARVLKPGGRLAIADIITEKPLKESIVCDVDLWSSCIGGAAQEETYAKLIGAAGFTLDKMRENERYEFLSEQARNASVKYGVKSVSLRAVKR
jgi:ubiquinone/menaquinone biosynthesis C-methylase UbiE